jgi:RNase P subunit RPR2
MRLRTLHTDSAFPGQLLGLFECPDCGHERRFPIESEDVV